MERSDYGESVITSGSIIFRMLRMLDWQFGCIYDGVWAGEVIRPLGLMGPLSMVEYGDAYAEDQSESMNQPILNSVYGR